MPQARGVGAVGFATLRPATGSTQGRAGRFIVNIFIYDFIPMALTVKVGTTVKWINDDEAAHTLVATDGTFVPDALMTKDIKPGDSFSFTFEKAGTSEYERSIHPAMKAKIVVTK